MTDGDTSESEADVVFSRQELQPQDVRILIVCGMENTAHSVARYLHDR